MTQWAVVIPTDQYETERLYHHDEVTVVASPAAVLPAEYDEVLVIVAGELPLVVGLGRVRTVSPGARVPAGAVGSGLTGSDPVGSGSASPDLVGLELVDADPASAPAPRGAESLGAEPVGSAIAESGGGVRGEGGVEIVVAYTRRAFDAPVPAPRLRLDDRVVPLDPAVFRDLSARLGAPVDRRTWLVSVDLPIEAESPAEAVRQFWSYVRQLGPRELPTFVWPSGDELAMQAFVLGAEANLDPEEEDED